MIKNKKGLALSTLYPAVITIVLIGVVLGIGLYVLLQTSDAVSSTSKTVVNETLTTVTEVGETVATATECGFHNFLPIAVTNKTNGALIPASNYTYNADLGGLSAVQNNGYFNNTDWNVTYSYQGGGTNSYCTSITTTHTGLGGMASWIAIIVVVIAAAVVLGLVMSSFRKEKYAV